MISQSNWYVWAKEVFLQQAVVLLPSAFCHPSLIHLLHAQIILVNHFPSASSFSSSLALVPLFISLMSSASPTSTFMPQTYLQAPSFLHLICFLIRHRLHYLGASRVQNSLCLLLCLIFFIFLFCEYLSETFIFCTNLFSAKCKEPWRSSAFYSSITTLISPNHIVIDI